MKPRHSRRARGATAAAQRGRSVIVWTARLLLPAYVAYVVVIGGDFLDLYRFFAPLLPLGLVLATSALLPRVDRGAIVAIALALGVVLLAGHAFQQERLARRALQVAEPERGTRGIEPLGWTRLYALRWAATGRWIAAHANPGDWMAVGAAGAMPYYAGIANLDTFGLCDAWVAHEGPIVGNRPGHQRFAPESYILSKHPAFLLIGNDYTSDQPRPLRRDRKWEQRGYVWAEARIDADHFGAPSPFYHYLLMRLDRAQQHAGSAWLRFSSNRHAQAAAVRALCLSAGALALREVDAPEPGAGEALIRVAMAGICNTDLELAKGYMGFSGVLGHELCGVVEACDDARWVGKRVAGEINLACTHCDLCRRGLSRHCPTRTVMGIVGKDGCFADYVTLPLRNLHVLPDSIADEVACFVEPVAAAFEVLEQVTPMPRDRVAVLGDGKLACSSRRCCERPAAKSCWSESTHRSCSALTRSA